jgi:anti-sigma factor RsiW
MTIVTYLISEEDLHAYVDDALDARRRQAVETCLSQDDDLAAKVAVYRAQKLALKLLERPTGPLPDSIRALCRMLAKRLTQGSQTTDIWDKMPPKRKSKFSTR